MAKQSMQIGQRYGRLIIIELGERYGTVYHDKVKCECGTVKTVRRGDIQTGRVKSCGCLRRERTSKIGLSHYKHGHSKNPLYHIWYTMIARCHNSDHANYHYYGARGIQVCDRWRTSFEAFATDMGPRPIGFELDRIDPDGDYAPCNVRWIDHRGQLQNRVKRSDRYIPRSIEWNGIAYTISDLAAMGKTSYETMYYRIIRKGMSIQSAISMSPKRQK